MTDSTVSEFNSNKFVIERVNRIIDNLNYAFNVDDPGEIIKWERALLRELWPKLTTDQKKIFDELFDAAKQATAIPEDVRICGGIGSGRVIYILEQVSLKLMEYADNHGMLMTNKDNPKFSALK